MHLKMRNWVTVPRCRHVLRFTQRYNVTSGQQIAVVSAKDGGRRLSMMRWGLIPSRVKEPNISYRLINTRSETV